VRQSCTTKCVNVFLKKQTRLGAVIYFTSNVSVRVFPVAGACTPCRSHRGCCHLWETDKIRSNFALQISGRIWRTTRLEVEVGVTFRTVVIRLFRLRVLYSEFVCPLFIPRTLPLCSSVFTDKILHHASTFPFFANDGTISLASLCGIFGGRSDSRLCFCASIAVLPCQYCSNSAPCSYSFVCG